MEIPRNIVTNIDAYPSIVEEYERRMKDAVWIDREVYYKMKKRLDRVDLLIAENHVLKCKLESLKNNK